LAEGKKGRGRRGGKGGRDGGRKGMVDRRIDAAAGMRASRACILCEL